MLHSYIGLPRPIIVCTIVPVDHGGLLVIRLMLDIYNLGSLFFICFLVIKKVGFCYSDIDRVYTKKNKYETLTRKVCLLSFGSGTREIWEIIWNQSQKRARDDDVRCLVLYLRRTIWYYFFRFRRVYFLSLRRVASSKYVTPLLYQTIITTHHHHITISCFFLLFAIYSVLKCITTYDATAQQSEFSKSSISLLSLLCPFIRIITPLDKPLTQNSSSYIAIVDIIVHPRIVLSNKQV